MNGKKINKDTFIVVLLSFSVILMTALGMSVFYSESGSEVQITVSLIEIKKVIFIDRNECEMLRFHIMNNKKGG